MSSLNQKIMQERQKIHSNIKKFNKEDSVYEQLLVIEANNGLNYDSLPKKFYLRNISLSKEDLDSLLNNLGISFESKVVNSGGMYGDWYEIKLL